MGLLTDLLRIANPTPADGRKPRASPDIAAQTGEVERALDRLRAERDAADGEITAAAGKRRAMLAEDAPAADIIALDDATEAHRIQLEKLELAEPPLLARLHALHSEARRREWVLLRRQHTDACVTYVAALRTTHSKWGDVIEARQRAEQAGFRVEVRHDLADPVNPPDLALVDRFEAELERRAEGYVPPAPVLPEGQYQVRFHRMVADHGHSYRTGDEATLPEAECWRLVRQGAADWIGEPPPDPLAAAPEPEAA